MLKLKFIKFASVYGIRSLARNGRRSLFLFATVALAVLSAILANSYAAAVFEFWIASTTETGTGHAQIHQSGFWTETDGLNRTHCFPDGHPIEKILEADNNVVAISRRIQVEGLISAGTKSIYFNGFGIDPREEILVSPRLVNFEGNLGSFVSSDDLSGIVIGKGMADTLDLSIGDVVTLTIQTLPEEGQGALNGKDVVVTGIMDYPQKMVSKRLIYMNLQLAQQIMQVEGLYSEIAIRLHSNANLEQWIRIKKSEFNLLNAELRPWWEIFPPMRKVEEIFRQIVGAICFLLFLSASISLLNIVFLTVTERTVEMGILMSIGAKAKDVRRMLGIEAIILGIIGGGVGLIIGNLLVMAMNFFGMPLPNPLFRGVVYIHPEIDLAFTLVVFVLGVAICWVSTLLPAFRAGRVEPVVAFRGHL